MSTNDISVEITQEKDTAVNQLVDNITSEFDWLIDLAVEDRRRLAKMGRKNLDLVERSYQHAERNPQFLPAFMPFEEFKKDVDLYGWLRRLEKRLGLIFDKIGDTAMLAEAEAYQTARLYYTSVKAAAKAGNDNAELIARDLAVHFKKLGPKKEEPPQEEPQQ